MKWNERLAARTLLVLIAREIVHLYERRYGLEQSGLHADLDGVCRRLLAAVEASFPGVVADWIDSRQARLEAEISQLLRDQRRPGDTPF
jgi:hypothetical protein